MLSGTLQRPTEAVNPSYANPVQCVASWPCTRQGRIGSPYVRPPLTEPSEAATDRIRTLLAQGGELTRQL